MDDRNNQSEERSFQSSGYGAATGNQNSSNDNSSNTNNQPSKEE